MFHTLLNVQGEAISLLQYIDNHSGNVRVELRAITYTMSTLDSRLHVETVVKLQAGRKLSFFPGFMASTS